jgi:threonine dehydrogenase-like Zn-dependent dehydrogenase
MQHRDRVTELLSRGRGRLVVLGAGPCGDLDLRALAAVYDEIHLVDIDEPAMVHGAALQGATGAVQLHCADVTGPLPDVLARGGFDVVASTCLLSQLVRAAVQAWGADHPQVGERALALRDRHLELLVELARPGGRAILVTDFVSDTTYPRLLTIGDDDDLAALERTLVEARNFFTGANPFAIRRAISNHAAVASQRVEGRWIWRPADRAFLVVALSVERHGPQ